MRLNLIKSCFLKNKNNLLHISITFIIFFILAKISSNKSRDKIQEIKSNLGLTNGIIKSYEWLGSSDRITYYSYYVNQIEYEGSYSARRFKGCEDTKWCIGKVYDVYYSKLNPEKSILIIPNDDTYSEFLNYLKIHSELPAPIHLRDSVNGED